MACRASIEELNHDTGNQLAIDSEEAFKASSGFQEAIAAEATKILHDHDQMFERLGDTFEDNADEIIDAMSGDKVSDMVAGLLVIRQLKNGILDDAKAAVAANIKTHMENFS